ncbi:MAG: F0F1 ATP synthase subunit delta [Microbacteriaceae bacterium]
MGSATRQALAVSKAALADLGSAADLATAENLFEAARVIGESGQLRAAIADPSAGARVKSELIARVFGDRVSKPAATLLASVASGRWSNQDDLLAAIEELGIRAAARSVGERASLESELFAFGSAVTSDPQLELALGSQLGSVEAKVSLVDALLVGKANDATIAIVRQLVRQPRGRSLRSSAAAAAAIVADEAGLAIATVTSAVPLTSAQLERLSGQLSTQYSRRIKLNVLIDPAVIAGLRIRIGDDVVDGTIASRINDVKMRIAG